ncbi:1233_t:CDS:2, partial [Diversispora eburnea]
LHVVVVDINKEETVSVVVVVEVEANVIVLTVGHVQLRVLVTVLHFAALAITCDDNKSIEAIKETIKQEIKDNS